MSLWSKKKPKETPFKSWKLPGDIGTVSLPEFLSVELEDEKTLLAHPGNDLISIRFSSISFTKKGVCTDEVARPYVRKKSEEENHPYYEIGDMGVLSFEKPSEQDGKQLLIRYWYVGSKSTLVIVSATMLSSKLEEPCVTELLSFMPRIIETVAITKTHKFAEYEGHKVPITQEVVAPQAQKITPFGPSENAWLEENRQLAASLSVTYGSGGELSPEELDVVFSRWTFDDDNKESGELVANALGATFGDYLVEEHGFRWVVVSDQYGTDYAVRHPIGETMAFPVSSVGKRIERNEAECFQNLRVAVLATLKQRMEESS